MRDTGSTSRDVPVKHGRRGFGEYAEFEPLFRTWWHLPAEDPLRSPLRDELVTAHLPLAQHLAGRYTGRGEPRDDLVQVAVIGLIRAVDRYDPNYGRDFLAYAIPTVTGEIKRHFRDHGWRVHIPRSIKDLHVTVGRVAAELTMDLGRPPTTGELADHLQVPEDDVRNVQLARQASHTWSLDVPIAYSESGVWMLSDLVGDDDQAIVAVERRAMLTRALRALPAQQQRVVVLRFVHQKTQRQIAEAIGASQMHVSSQLVRALQRLRTQLATSTHEGR